VKESSDVNTERQINLALTRMTYELTDLLPRTTLQEYVGELFDRAAYISVDGSGSVWAWTVKPRLHTPYNGAVIWDAPFEEEPDDVGCHLVGLSTVLAGVMASCHLTPFVWFDEGENAWWMNADEACLELTPNLTFQDIFLSLLGGRKKIERDWWNHTSFRELILHE